MTKVILVDRHVNNPDLDVVAVAKTDGGGALSGYVSTGSAKETGNYYYATRALVRSVIGGC